MSEFVLTVVGGCIAIYGAAWLLRGLVWAFSRIASRELTQHRVRYTTITVATLILFLLSIFAQGPPGASDDARPWLLLLSGVLVFAGSVGYSYWMWRKALQAPPEEESPLEEESPDEEPSFSLEDEEYETDSFEDWFLRIGIAGALIAVMLMSSYDVEPETIIALMMAPFYWLGDGFVAAVSNPGYWAGLVVGIGTGWILRGGFTE